MPQHKHQVESASRASTQGRKYVGARKYDVLVPKHHPKRSSLPEQKSGSRAEGNSLGGELQSELPSSQFPAQHPAPSTIITPPDGKTTRMFYHRYAYGATALRYNTSCCIHITCMFYVRGEFDRIDSTDNCLYAYWVYQVSYAFFTSSTFQIV